MATAHGTWLHLFCRPITSGQIRDVSGTARLCRLTNVVSD